MRPLVYFNEDWVLSDSQKKTLLSLRLFDMGFLIDKSLVKNIRHLVWNKFTKNFNILMLQNQHPSCTVLDESLTNLLPLVFSCSVLNLNKDFFLLYEKRLQIRLIMFSGAFKALQGTIKNFDIQRAPTVNTVLHSSVLINPKSDVNINIGI